MRCEARAAEGRDVERAVEAGGIAVGGGGGGGDGEVRLWVEKG